MIRYILFSFLILILGCDAKPLIPLSNKDTTSIIVNNFHVKKLPFPKDGYIIIDAEKTIYDIANNYNLFIFILFSTTYFVKNRTFVYILYLKNRIVNHG